MIEAIKEDAVDYFNTRVTCVKMFNVEANDIEEAIAIAKKYINENYHLSYIIGKVSLDGYCVKNSTKILTIEV